MDKEKWVSIKGYEGLYEISDLGGVKSIYRTGIGRHRCKRIFRGKVLLQPISRDLYHTVALCKDGKVKRFYTHRLIALNFLNNESNKPQINHINGIKTDNRPENLEWCTGKENAIHANKTGLSKVGTRHYLAKLNEEQVRSIRMDKRSQKDIAENYNISIDTVYKVRHKITYASVL